MAEPQSPELPFEPYELLNGRPHVMVDGAAREGSVLTLSHWPQSPTAAFLARDVSAAIVLEYVRLSLEGVPNTVHGPQGRAARSALARGRAAEAVTNDHFDEDGLMSVLALVDPKVAMRMPDVIVGVADCGDFGVVHDRRIARIAFAIAPLAEAEAGAGSGTSARYLAMLPIVGELLEHPERFESYWSTEAAELAAGEAAIERGDVAITEHADLDLAVVNRVAVSGSGRLPGAEGGLPVHAAAVHSATPASRIVAFDGERAECYLRYEGWVRTVSRRVPLRPDLAPLAAELTATEPSGLEWEANGVGAIVGRLRPGGDGRTEIEPERLVEIIRRYLATAEPAWDPWRAGGAYVPEGERSGYEGRYGRRVRTRRPRRN